MLALTKDNLERAYVGDGGMFNPSNSDHTGSMLIKTLTTMFGEGQISLEEMWDRIDKEIQCHHFGSQCLGIPDICPCSREIIHQ